MAELLELVFGCNLCGGLEALGGAGLAMAVAKLADLVIDWVIVEKVLKCKACGRSDVSVNFEEAVEVEQEGYPIHLIVLAIVIAVCAAKSVRLAHAASTRAEASGAAMPAPRNRKVRTKQEAHAD